MAIARRFHLRFISSSSSQAAAEILNLVSGSNIEQLGRSSAAPISSETPIRRRVSKGDRKALLQSFVNKYRDMNMGKFPSPSCAKKEVGGSYYVIRKMLQEIEYDFRTSSVEKGLIKDHKKQTEGESTTCMEISTESSGSQEVFDSPINMVQLPGEDPVTVNNFDNYELNRVLQPSTSSASTGRSNIRTDDTHDIDSHDTKVCHEKLEQKPKYEFPLECQLLFEKLQSKVENQQHEIRNIALETCDTVVQCYEKLEQMPEEKPKGEFPLEDKSVYDDSQSKVGKQPDGIENIATESRNTEAQCHRKVEQKPEDKLIDESPLEEKFVSEDLQSKVELHHDGTSNIERETSLWVNLKRMATEFINIWKK